MLKKNLRDESNQYFLKVFLFAIIFLVLPNFSKAAIIFEDNFDAYSDFDSGDSRVAYPNTLPGNTSNPVFGAIADQNNAPGWWYYNVGTAGTRSPSLYTVSNAHPYGGIGKALNIDYEKGDIMGGSLVAMLAPNPQEGYSELWIRQWIRVPDNYDSVPYNTGDGANSFTKTIHLGHWFPGGSDEPASTHEGQDGDYNCFKKGCSAYLEMTIDGNAQSRNQIIYLNGHKVNACGLDYYEHIYVDAAQNFTWKGHQGEWIYYQWHIKRNSFNINGSPNNDALTEVWSIPENQIASYDINSPTFTFANNYVSDCSSAYDPLHYPVGTETNWNLLVLWGNMDFSSGTTDGSNHITWSSDDLVVSTAPIGPEYIISGVADTTTPSAPNGLNVL